MNEQDRVEQVKEIVGQLVEEEVQASRFQAFADYAQAHRAMETDRLVQFIRLQVASLNEILAETEKLYRAAMAGFGKDIEAIVLELGQTVEVAGVTASYTKGVARPSWKAVAMTFEPGRELIDEHTKVGKPSVRIEMTGGKGERA